MEPHAMAAKAAEFFGVGEDLRQFMEDLLSDDASWMLSSVFDGVRLVRLPSDDPSHRWVLARVPGGWTIPRHLRSGPTDILVLDGAYEQDGRVYAAGDTFSAGNGVSSARHIEPGRECIVAVRIQLPSPPGRGPG